MTTGRALVATEAAHEREAAKDDATGGEQNTLSDTELDGTDFADARDELAARAADALAEAKRLKQAKAANDRQTKEHAESLQRRRPQEQARTEPAAERNEENRRGDRTPSRERRVRPGGQAARRQEGRAPRRDRHGSTPTPTEDEVSGNEDDELRAPEPRAKKAKKAKNR